MVLRKLILLFKKPYLRSVPSRQDILRTSQIRFNSGNVNAQKGNILGYKDLEQRRAKVFDLNL